LKTVTVVIRKEGLYGEVASMMIFSHQKKQSPIREISMKNTCNILFTSAGGVLRSYGTSSGRIGNYISTVKSAVLMLLTSRRHSI